LKKHTRYCTETDFFKPPVCRHDPRYDTRTLFVAAFGRCALVSRMPFKSRDCRSGDPPAPTRQYRRLGYTVKRPLKKSISSWRTEAPRFSMMQIIERQDCF
jgi:hypothetical protein